MSQLPNPFVESDTGNHYQAVIHAARKAQLDKARAVQDAYQTQQQAFAEELPGLIREEEAYRRLLGR
ncbi:MAG TPA: hypothetical protein V6D23_26655 [Candidatus Obscuribacterales bacterium]